MKALTQEQLKPMGCSVPNCGHDHTVLYLNQRCHPSAGTEAFYNKRTKILTIVCQKCKELVADIKVAAR